ncbi:MAG: hypothetical protein HYY52_03285 [Candidatus Melainabacteria bacterium]|nr:hypothetical protein [Candidatus Melainabacteria bacterium]
MQQISMEIMARQVFSQNGYAIPSEKNFPNKKNITSNDHAADLSNVCYREINKFPISPGIAAAGIEVVGATALWKCFPGPATWVNMLTTAAETVSVLISSFKFDKKTKDGVLAWFQVLSGISGYAGTAKEIFLEEKENNFNDVAFLNKLFLSTASLLNVFTMFSGAIEKSMLSMVSWNKNENEREVNGSEYRTSLTTALSDRRCSVEWSVMSLLPWLSDIQTFNLGKIFKYGLDIFMPYQAIREGLDTFVDNPDTMLLREDISHNSFVKSFLKNFVNPLKLFSESKKNSAEETENKYKLCRPFNYFLKFLIGTEGDQGGAGRNGIRNYFLKPLFRFFGCKTLPDYFLDKDENIVVVFSRQKQQETSSADKVAEQEKALPEPARELVKS